MSLVFVAYVGKKPFAADNVANSGKVWHGAGDVQQVTAAQAKILTKFPDQWELVDSKSSPLVARSGVVSVFVDGSEVAIDVDAIRKPLDKMTKAEMIAVAKVRLSKEFNSSLSRKVLLDEIRLCADDLGVQIDGVSPLGHSA